VTAVSAAPSTVSARLIPLVVAGISAAGGRPARVLARVDLAARPASSVEGRLTHGEAFALLEAAADAVDDAAFGLHLAERLRPGALGVIDHLIRSAPTLGAALALAGRYQRLIQDAELTVESRRDRAVQRYALCTAGEVSPPFAECVLAGAVVWTRQITSRGVDPVEVRFAHRRPRDTREHARIFRAPLRFDAGENAVVFPARTLALPVVGADADLLAVLETHAAALLAELPRRDRLSDRARDVIADDLAVRQPSLARVAARLRMSPRTLRRRLRAERTSPWRLLDALRREAALAHAREGRLGTREIGVALGFSDASAFHKAFRRWTGGTPPARRTVSS